VKVHSLKYWTEFFEAVVDGRKPFELRVDDRGYCEGDVLLLEEWTPDNKTRDRSTGTYTGRATTVLVTYLMRGLILGLKEGWVVMGIRPHVLKAGYVSELKGRT
jgi:hypothetical protein